MAESNGIEILNRYGGGEVIAEWWARASLAIRGRFDISGVRAQIIRARTARIIAILVAIASSLLLVSAARAHAEPVLGQGIETRGIISPVHEAMFVTDLKAPVAAVAYRDGDSFTKGDVLIEFDCRRQKAELASMKAQHREMTVQFEGNIYLQNKGAVGKQELEVSRARADRAGHDARAFEVRLERCVIEAPFDGRIGTLAINKHETPASGKPILHIIGTDTIELQLIVPSLWLVWLKEGAPFRFTIDETSRTYDASIRRIGAAVDPVSQTISLTGELVAAAPEVRAGMSGTATFPSPLTHSARAPSLSPPVSSREGRQ